MAVAAATKAVAAKPSRAELIGRAEKIALMAREQALETERNRTVSPELIAAMREAGLFRVMQPEAFDGFEYGYDVFVDCVAAISAGDGSIGWVYSLGAVHPWMFAGLPLQTQHEIWDDNRDAIAAVSYAPTGTAEAVDGGYRLSGRWSFASGCDNADWAIVSAPMPRAGGKVPGFFFLPRRDVTIDDDWFTMGLAGTGSKSFVIDNAFVPHHRTEVIPDLLVGNPPGAAVNPNPLYRQPFLSVVPACLVAPQIGMARGALDVFVEQVKSRKTRGAVAGGGNSMADFTAVQMRVAEAAACIDAATLLIHRDSERNRGNGRTRRAADARSAASATGATIPLPRSCRCRRSMRCLRRRAAPASACGIRCSASGATCTPPPPTSASTGTWSAPCTASTSSGWSHAANIDWPCAPDAVQHAAKRRGAPLIRRPACFRNHCLRSNRLHLELGPDAVLEKRIGAAEFLRRGAVGRLDDDQAADRTVAVVGHQRPADGDAHAEILRRFEMRDVRAMHGLPLGLDVRFVERVN